MEEAIAINTPIAADTKLEHDKPSPFREENLIEIYLGLSYVLLQVGLT